MSHENSRRCVLLVFTTVLVGCQRPIETHFPEPKSAAVYRKVSTGTSVVTGRLTGTVQWTGEQPKAEPIRGLIDTKDGAVWGQVENPFLPQIRPGKMVNNVLIQLLNPPDVITQEWPYAEDPGPLRLENRYPPVEPQPTDFIQVGKTGLLADEEPFSQIRARGASFFTRSFGRAGSNHRMSFDQPGLVELSDTNGKFWRYRRIYVCDHPYYATTNQLGQFDLGRLPPGEYDIRASIPNWQIISRDRDPETGRLMQLHRGPDITTQGRIKVEAGIESKLTLTLSSPVALPPTPLRAP